MSRQSSRLQQSIHIGRWRGESIVLLLELRAVHEVVDEGHLAGFQLCIVLESTDAPQVGRELRIECVASKRRDVKAKDEIAASLKLWRAEEGRRDFDAVAGRIASRAIVHD